MSTEPRAQLIGSPTLPPPGDVRRYSFSRLMHCPVCNSVRIRYYKTERSADGKVVTRHVECQTCGHHFIGIWD